MRLAIVLMILLVAGCAAPTTKQTALDPELIRQEEEKQKELALESDREYNERLQRVAWPILSAATPLCDEDTSHRLGVNFANVHSFDDDYRDAARNIYGIDEFVRITAVTGGGPAEAAGIRPGDRVVKINGKKLPTGKKAIEKTIRIAQEALEDGGPVSLELNRNDQAVTKSIQPIEVCSYGVQLLAQDDLNAFADGSSIYVTRGMMRFADSDRELAVVVAHELAHNSHGHIDAKKSNFWLGAIFDIAAAAYGVNTQGAFANTAAQAYSKEFEAEADYVGMYALALADIDMSEAADFWRQMGAENPSGILKAYATTHPSTAERFLAIENTVDEIRQKKELGLPLQPELKE